MRRAYESLPKTAWHGQDAIDRHPDIQPEWIMRIIESPYDRWTETSRDGALMTILVGRVPEFGQWIKLVFWGTLETGALHTAYADRRLARTYGGPPWRDA